jgi:protein disulfide isomerase
VEAHGQPRVARLGSKESRHQAALKRVAASEAPRMFVLCAFDGASMDAPLLAAMQAAATVHPELDFIIGDAATSASTVSFFGLSADDLPAAVLHDVASNDKKYTRASITPEGLEDFIADFRSGLLVPIVKSEPIPEDNSAPVIMLVAKNFDAIVGLPAAAGKTILLNFHAPWCAHCKMLAPVYEEVGEHFAGRNNVVIAKMDADANSVTDDRFKVTGFPMLFVQTRAGDVVRYMGERSKEPLIAFVEQHTAVADESALVSDAAVASALQAEL